MKFSLPFICTFLLFLLNGGLDYSAASPQGALVQRWANLLGSELWILGKVVTNRQEIENNYKTVKVETKDPRKIIEEIVGNVSSMMNKKMDAVNCIIEAAELAAEEFELNDTDRNYTYYRSNPTDIYLSEAKEPDPNMFLNMSTNNDTHFFNLLVNTNHSSVHVPINVYHKHDEPEAVIKWSEVLDDVFKQNYRADPALSWQYFGSSSGIMRHYPAMLWGNNDQGLFDCRIRTWFIEAATCTKDVVILLDNSGSMTGMNKHIASLVVNTILDTLSNNDYINIMNYSEAVNYTVPCFKDQIVQATQENILVFKDAIKTLEPVNKSLTENAVIEAFELLYKYRRIRQCYGKSKFCNQAIMLVTDGIQTNLSDIINKYNRIQNESSIPIRIFTFLVGKEATQHEESMWMACTNRGYHSHVDALEQVTAAVYKYIMVFARPLVLHGKNPLSWTHAYYDDTYDFGDKNSLFEKYRLLTSVAGPVLDQKAKSSNETKSAKLLGVAATDVPVSEISKLMYHYKTGVNSHSFIISNNGYVLKHPDLRPMFEDVLKVNYNSIDLTEVEQLDDDLGPRELGDEVLELRDALVEGREGGIRDVKIKYHYDDMRRVSREVNDYYFAPINGTPFSIGFAIPDLYGNYSIEVRDEIQLHRFSTKPISDFFKGKNWKIHPKWVYCKYHYLEGHEFDTPESELVHFVKKMTSDNFKWSMQYEVDLKHKQSAICGAKTLGDDDYYCDRDLVKHLVFDAKLTKPAFEVPRDSEDDVEISLRSQYNATLRFVATMSGLTRWEYLSEHTPGTPTFGDLHPRAIDETWYKSAVIQHRYNDNSFVYSVPFDSQDDEDLLVTASYAIFPEKDGVATPGAVVGFQFSHSHLQKQFFNITTTTRMCRECLPCGPELDCYVIDSSGYIIISNDKEDTGVFFGEIDGAIMEAMLQEKIFEKVTIRDYQALCYYQAWVSGGSEIIMTPFYYLLWATKWIFSQITWLFIRTSLYQLWDPLSVLISADEQASTYVSTATPKPSITRCHKKCKEEEEKWHEKNKIPVYEKAHTACEKERDLYVLQQQLFSHKDLYPDIVSAMPCIRPFYLKMIPHSNLLLIAIKTRVKPPSTCYFTHNTRIRDIVYENETTFPCQKLYLNTLSRRPLQGCYNEHPLEQEITECGRSAKVYFNIHLTVIGIAFVMAQSCMYI